MSEQLNMWQCTTNTNVHNKVIQYKRVSLQATSNGFERAYICWTSLHSNEAVGHLFINYLCSPMLEQINLSTYIICVYRRFLLIVVVRNATLRYIRVGQESFIHSMFGVVVFSCTVYIMLVVKCLSVWYRCSRHSFMQRWYHLSIGRSTSSVATILILCKSFGKQVAITSQIG